MILPLRNKKVSQNMGGVCKKRIPENQIFLTMKFFLFAVLCE